MAKLYQQKTLAKNSASVGDQNQGVFTYRGFSSTAVSKNFKLYDIDIVKQDLINHFYIRKGEKLENPDFGTIIWELLFEQFTPDVKDMIVKDVEEIINYDPRLVVQEIEIDSTDIGIRIQANIVYLPFNITESMIFDFDRNNNIIN